MAQPGQQSEPACRERQDAPPPALVRMRLRFDFPNQPNDPDAASPVENPGGYGREVSESIRDDHDEVEGDDRVDDLPGEVRNAARRLLLVSIRFRHRSTTSTAVSIARTGAGRMAVTSGQERSRHPLVERLETRLGTAQPVRSPAQAPRLPAAGSCLRRMFGPVAWCSYGLSMDDLGFDELDLFDDELDEEASPRARWHASAMRGVARGLRKALDEHGELPDDASDRLADAVSKIVEQTASDIVETLREAAPEMLEDHAGVWDSIRDEVRSVWGGALDQLYAIVVCADESSRYFVNEQIADAHRDSDTQFAALAGLLAQACRVGLEVWHLLTSGFVAGAAARSRTLHEMNVVATVLADHGREGQLAERYVAHATVDEWRYFRAIAEHNTDDQEVLVVLEAEVETLCADFGPAFRNANGWAAELLGNPKPKFRDLEDLAGLGGWRGTYVESSHAIHPSALAARWNVEEGGSVTSWRLSGLADPAISTLGSLVRLVATVFNAPDDVNTMDLVTMSTLAKMSAEAQEAFHEAEARAADKLASERVHPEPPDSHAQ